MDKTVVFDFDGVINSYKSGWTEVNNLPDPPVEGIKESIEEIRKAGYRVVVSSARASDMRGFHAIRAYLWRYGIGVDEVTNQKPPAIVYIDDRAITFNGNAKSLLSKIESFTPWYLKESNPSTYDRLMAELTDKMIMLYGSKGSEQAIFLRDLEEVAKKVLGDS